MRRCRDRRGLPGIYGLPAVAIRFARLAREEA